MSSRSSIPRTGRGPDLAGTAEGPLFRTPVPSGRLPAPPCRHPRGRSAPQWLPSGREGAGRRGAGRGAGGVWRRPFPPPLPLPTRRRLARSGRGASSLGTSPTRAPEARSGKAPDSAVPRGAGTRGRGSAPAAMLPLAPLASLEAPGPAPGAPRAETRPAAPVSPGQSRVPVRDAVLGLRTPSIRARSPICSQTPGPSWEDRSCVSCLGTSPEFEEPNSLPRDDTPPNTKLGTRCPGVLTRLLGSAEREQLSLVPRKTRP